MAGFADALTPMQPPKTGFADVLAAAFGAGPDKMGAYQKGIDAGSQVGLRSAQTEGALARAETDRAERIQKELVNDVYRKAQATPGYAGSLADMLVTGRNPQQYGLDPLSVQEHDFRAGIADPGTSWEQLQRNRMALGDAPAQRFDPLGAGRGVQDLMAGTLNPTMQPIDTATLDTERAQAENYRERPAAGGNFTLGGVRYGPDGQPIVPIDEVAANAAAVAKAVAAARSPPAGAVGSKPLTEFQVKALSQLSRMDRTEDLFKTEFLNYVPPLADVAMDAVPGVGNYAVSKEYQQYKQAANEWISGLLRLDSGAAVPETEFKRYFVSFFPQPGDGPDNVAQKAAAREAATSALRAGLPQVATAIDASRPRAAAAQGAEPSPKTQAEYDALPPGAVYVDTDGKRKRKR